MTISVDVPALIESGEPFPITLSNDEVTTVDVTLTIKVVGKPRDFRSDNTPRAGSHVVRVGPLTARICTISDWGGAPSKTLVEITANPGNTGTSTVT